MVIASGLKDGMGRGKRMGWVRRSLQAAVLAVVTASVPEALGGGGSHIQVNNVAAGSATFSQAGSVTTVRTGSKNTIINYEQLSVGSGDTLNFVQPSSKSRVLNRIEGTSPSEIDGSITSNGAVFLMNPNGVVFGHGAMISVNQFVAAAGRMSDADFLGGVNHITGVSGPVVNYGVINAHQVSLVGLTVGNFGEIIAGPGGVVTMTSGDDVYIGTVDTPGSSPHILVKVSQNTAAVKAGTGVTNGGTISSGQINLGAGDLYAAGIYNSGTLRGAQITLNSGANTNTVAGTIDASSATGKGGTVAVLGDKVALGSQSAIIASGKTGGGTILVGGDIHGSGTTPTSSTTTVDSGAALTADAISSGNGGKIIVWSNVSTEFFGAISAQGGAISGNGGFAEVSSRQDLTYAGSATTYAPRGKLGELLLDPTDLEIVNGGGVNKIDPGTFTGSQTDVSLTATGNILVTDAISMSNTTTHSGISLDAGGNITLSNNITTRGGNIVLIAGDQSQGAVAAGNITMNGKTLDTTNGANPAGANITLRAGSMTSAEINGTIKAGNGSVNSGVVMFYSNIASHTFAIGSATGGDITLTDSAIQNVSGASKVIFGEQGVQTGNITIQKSSPNNSSAFEFNNDGGSGEILLDNNNSSTAFDIGTTHALTMRAGSAGILAQQLGTVNKAEIQASTVSLTSAGGIGNSTNPVKLTSGTGTVTASATGDVFLQGFGALGVATVSGANVNLTAKGNLTASGNLTATSGLLTLTATGGATNNITGTGNWTATANLSANAGGNLTNTTGNISGSLVALVSVGDLSVASVSATGGGLLLLTTSGNVNASGLVSAASTLDLEAGGDIGDGGAVSVSPGTTLTLSSGSSKAITVSVTGPLLASNLTLPTVAGTRLITLGVNGNFTVDGNVGIPSDNYVITTTSGGNITSTGLNTLTGKNLTLTAAGAVNLNTNTNGTTLSVTTSGVGNLGDITIVDAKVTTGPDITTTTDAASAQTISLTAASFTANHSYGDVNRNDNVSLIASTGAVNGSGTPILAHDLTLSGTSIGAGTAISGNITGNLSLTTTTGGANVTLASTDTLDTTNSTFSIVSGQALTLSVGTLAVNSSVGTVNNALTLTTTTGGITGTGTVAGSTITLTSKTGIGAQGTPLNVSTAGSLTVTTQGNSAAGNMFILDAQPLTLTVLPTTSGTGNQTIALGSSDPAGITINLPLLAGGDSVSLTADVIAFGLTGSVTSSNTVTIAPFTNNEAVEMSSAVDSGSFLNINDALLGKITAGTLVIGASSLNSLNGNGSGTITVGSDVALDYTSAVNFHFTSLTLASPAGVTFMRSVTLKDNATLTFLGTGQITSSGSADVIIGGTTGNVVFTGIVGNVGVSALSPLRTQVEQLGGATGNHAIFLANSGSATGNLTVTGAINLTTAASSGSMISEASPLIINMPVSIVGDFTLLAGSIITPGAGDDLTINASLTSAAPAGTITLEAGHSISQTAGNITASSGNFTAALGNISQSGTGNIVLTTALTASGNTGISLAGGNNTIPSINLTNTASGTIAVTTGGNLSIAGVSQTGGGSITLIAGGDVVEPGTITVTDTGANLIVKTHTVSGANITLGSANNIGNGNITIESLNATTGVLAGNISYTSAGNITVQSIETTGNVALTASTTIVQDSTDAIGIHSAGLTVISGGLITLLNGNNTFSGLTITDNGTNDTLQFTTANSSSGLTIGGITQTSGDAAIITNTTGNITSSAILTVATLSVSAKGGISLSNDSSAFSNVSATNITSGDINIHDGSLMTVTSLSESGGGQTFLTSGSGISVQGIASAGAGFTANVTATNGSFTVVSTTGSISSSGPITITADNMDFQSGSTTTATGSGSVILQPKTAGTVITLNGTDGAGVLGITSGELATITAGNITIGNTTTTSIGNAGSTFNLPTNVILITQGSVDLTGMPITTAAGAKLSIFHTGALTMGNSGNATLSGGFVEAGVSGSGAGGTVTLTGYKMTVGAATATFNSSVVVSNFGNLTTNTTGSNFSFAAIDATTSGVDQLSITAGTGTVTFGGAIGGTTPMGPLQVVSSGAIGLGGNIETAGAFVSLASTGAITLVGGDRTIDTTNAGGIFPGNDIQLAGGVTGVANSLTLTGGSSNGNISVTSFTSTGNFTASGKQFTNSGTIMADVISITNSRPATISGDLTATGNLTVDGTAFANSTFTDTSSVLSGSNVTITQTLAISIGGNITSGANVTLTSTGSSVSATGNVSGAGTIAYSASTTVTTGNITDTTGPFTSSGGSDFTNNGNVSAVGITITNAGADTFSGFLAAGTGNLSVTGGASISDTSSTLSGGNVTLSASGIVSVGGLITATNNVSVTSTASSISTTGNVTGSGTIAYSAITSVGVGNVTSSGPGGLFTSQGGAFTNSGNITAVGLTITNTGVDTFNGALAAGTGNLSVTGGSSISDTSSTLSGGNVTLSAGGIVSVGGLITATNNVSVTSTASSISTTGNVTGSGTIAYSAITSVGVGNVTSSGPGGLFTSQGGAFTNSGNITAVGLTITNTGVDTFNGALAAGTGNLSVTGGSSISDTSSTLSGGNVTLSAGGIVSVGGLITATNNVSVTSTASSISTTGNVTGSGTIAYSAVTTVGVGNVTSSGPGGLFSSTGTDFTNSGNVTAVGITISNTGVDTFNGALAAGTGNLTVTLPGSISDTSGNLSGANVTLHAVNGISIGGTITSGANVTVTSDSSTVSTTGDVSGPGTIVYTAPTSVTVGKVTDTGGPFTSNGAGTFTNSGNVSAVGITINNGGLSTFNGTLAAGTGNLTVTLASGITDTSSNLSGGNVSLTASGVISVGGNITATNGVSVTSTGSSIATTGPVTGSTAITYSALTGVTVGNVTSSGPGGLFHSTGSSFTNSGDVTAVGITIGNTGADTINGNLTAGTGALLVNNASSIIDNANPLSGAGVTLSASGVVSVSSTITSTGIVSLTSTGSTILVTGNVGAAGDATFTSAGTTTLGNVTASVGNISVFASQANLAAGSAITATAGNVTFGNATVTPVALAGSANVTGNIATFTSTITGSTGALSVTANQTIFDGNIGTGIAPLVSVSVVASGVSPAITFNSGANGVFAETQSFGAATTLNNSFTFTGGMFTFGGSLNPTGATSLTVTGDGSGTLTFSGPNTGATLTPFTSINVTGVTSTSFTGSMVAGSVSIPTPVALGVGANSITASSAGVVGITLGNITGSSTSNLTLTSNGTGNLSGVTIIVGKIGTSGGRVGAIDFRSAAVTNLRGDIFATTVTFENNTGVDPGINPLAVPKSATIYYAGGGALPSGLVINTTGDFVMQRDQKLTVFDTTVLNSSGITSGTGSLEINTSAGGGNITVGDLSAMGEITLRTASMAHLITVINRPGTQELQPNGNPAIVQDTGADLVSGVRNGTGFSITGTMTIDDTAFLPSKPPVTLASGHVGTEFVNIANVLHIDPASNFKITSQVAPIVPITLTDFTLTAAPNTVLDLVAQGQPVAPNTIQGTVIPEDVATLTPERGETISGALRDALNELGVYARDLRTDEIIAYLVGRALYDDVPYKLNPDPTDNRIATNRLPYSPVLPMVESYEKLFFKFEKGSDGKMKKVPQDNAIKQAIGLAWVAYKAQMKDKATAEHFRAFLEANAKTNPKLAIALEDINGLRDLLVQIKNLGLTDNEFNVAQSALTKRVRPPNINDTDFLAAIMGPSTITHGQTAMR